MRYYEKSYSLATPPATNSTLAGSVGFSLLTAANNATIGWVPFKVVKRATPSVTTYSYASSTTSVVSNSGGIDQAAGSGSAASAAIGDSGFTIYNQSGTTLTLSGGAIIHFTASAEL